MNIFKKIVSYFTKNTPPKPEPEPEKPKPREDFSLFDYTKANWGHAISTLKRIDEFGSSYKIIGHGSLWHPINKPKGSRLTFSHFGIQKGDIIRISTKESGDVDFLVTEIGYKRDPADLFEATVQVYEEEV